MGIDDNSGSHKSTGRKVDRLPRSNTVRRDFADGHISVRTSYEELCTRYGADVWLEFKTVLREAGYDHGCLVLVDDENDSRFVAMMGHFGREVTDVEASCFFSTLIFEYIRRTRFGAQKDLDENVVHLRAHKSRFSVYRLPYGDYSRDTTAFFEERAEFMWEAHA